jgi:hypothetical protein
MNCPYSSEQIVAMAPDASSAKAGQSLSTPRKWASLGADARAVWGECQGSGSKPYQTQIELVEPAFKCSCPSRKFPCKHGLGLLLLYAGQSTLFTENTAPAWVNEWLENRTRKQGERTEKAQQKAEVAVAKAADPKTQARRIENREAKVRAGLRELDLWLCDLMRHGLAQLAQRDYRFWESIAARMVDAQAPGVARLLREMAGITVSGAGWQEELLRRLGLLHLLVQGYSRLESLPSATQADLRSLVGWTQSTDELMRRDGARDLWLVLGQRTEDEERLRVQRTWMWGRNTQRPALILHFAHGSTPIDNTLRPGSQIEADLVFFPGSVPLRAVIKERHSSPQPLQAHQLGSSINGAMADYAQSLSNNPWLESFPVALRDVWIVPGELWKVRDESGHELPLTPQFERGWHLLAAGGGAPFSLYGEWDGRQLRPFGALHGARWMPL